MDNSCLANADGDFLIVPQLVGRSVGWGGQDVRTGGGGGLGAAQHSTAAGRTDRRQRHLVLGNRPSLVHPLPARLLAILPAVAPGPSGLPARDD